MPKGKSSISIQVGSITPLQTYAVNTAYLRRCIKAGHPQTSKKEMTEIRYEVRNAVFFYCAVKQNDKSRTATQANRLVKDLNIASKRLIAEIKRQKSKQNIPELMKKINNFNDAYKFLVPDIKSELYRLFSDPVRASVDIPRATDFLAIRKEPERAIEFLEVL